MDGFTLRCNNLRCRAQLDVRAAVTTCRHPPLNGQRVCPACETTLSQPDDAVITALNPSDDYKTSVLSGLSPTIIMEVCSKGLGFWTYQVTQEVVYQEYLAKSLTERSKTLSGQLDKIIRDANSEIASLRDKIAAMTISEEELRRKNHELMEGWREKGRKLAQTQELYDKLKRRTLISQVRNAASENVNQAILMSAQQSASTHHPPHLQDLAAAHHTQQRPQNRRQRNDGQSDFIMTGARIGNVNGGMQPRSAESSVCSDQGGGISMAPPLRQSQRYKPNGRNEGGGFNGKRIPISLIK
ncbi:hypothetical protein DFP73DRAFT_481949 [Morchella snyderi]|nr:hypothetical protein DFP73DRAFT_481949 [Morchella snyderi]